MKHQKWDIEIDGENHTVERIAKSASSEQRIIIDGDEFVLPKKRFGFFTGRKEIFRLGEKQCILLIYGGGDVDIVIDGKYLSDGTKYS